MLTGSKREPQAASCNVWWNLKTTKKCGISGKRIKADGMTISKENTWLNRNLCLVDENSNTNLRRNEEARNTVCVSLGGKRIASLPK